MDIKDGYWNYYLAFRLKNTQKVLFDTFQKPPFSGLTSIITKDTIISFKTVDELLSKRLSEINACRQQLAGNESIDELYKQYDQDLLPEQFFDFNLLTNDDQLTEAINNSISVVSLIRDQFYHRAFYRGEERSCYYVLLPLKVYYTSRDYSYCPVYIQLLSNGNGVIKVSIPIHSIPTEFFATGTIQRWFSYIKVWDSLFNGNSKDGYKIVTHEQEGVMDIATTLMRYVENIFSSAVVDAGFFTGFETFVLSSCSNYNFNILNADTSDPKFLTPMYHFVFPEEHVHTPSKTELHEFWQKSYYDINGLKTVIGSNRRLIIYGDASRLAGRSGIHDIPDKNEYLQTYASIACDYYISLLIMQKQNDALIYDLAEHDQHTINSVMRQYYTDANYFDSLLVNIPKHELNFYKKLKEVLDNTSVDFHEMLNRIQLIEQHEESAFNERRAILLNCFALVFTILFGLPLIRDTLGLLKQIIAPSRDFIPLLTTESMSITVWVLLALSMLYINVKGSPKLKQLELKIKNFIIYRRFKKLPKFKQ